MAVGTLILPIGAATLPDDSTDNAPCAITRAQSTAAANPKAHWLQAVFDADTQEHMMWGFRMAQDYASAPILKVIYKMASATTAEVIIGVQVANEADGVQIDTIAFNTADVSSATTVPGTAGFSDTISLTLSNGDVDLAAGDFVVLMLYRDADAAGDDATGDMEVIAVSLEYTTS